MKTYQEIKEHIHPPIDDLDLDIPKNRHCWGICLDIT
jgi:hypothetical protein